MQTNESASLYIQSPKLNQLNLLMEVAADANITQAELAARCSLSAAMVNNYMKDFCNKDWIEYKRKSTKSVTYLLTPSGAKHVETLQTELIAEMVEMYMHAKEHIQARIMNQARSALHQIVIYGSGHLAQIVFHSLEKSNIQVLGVCDDDPKLVGGDLCGCEIVHPAQIRFFAPDAVIIADTLRAEEIIKSLHFLRNDGVQLIRLDKGVELKPNVRTQSQMHSLKTVRKKHPIADTQTNKSEY